MALTRRQFLRRSGLVVGGGIVAPRLFASPFLRSALAETIGDRYFVILYFDGGNDGLNTVTPMTAGQATREAYELWRNPGLSEGGTVGGIRLRTDALAPYGIGVDPNTGDDLAFHPGLAAPDAPIDAGGGGIHALHLLGKVATIQGCGYPEYSMSHATSSAIWETADPLGLAGSGSADGITTGWVGRYLADPTTGYTGLDIPAVAVHGAPGGELAQRKTSVLAIRRLRSFGFPQDPDYPDAAAKSDAFLALHAAALGSPSSAIQRLIGGAGTASFTASQQYPSLHESYRAQRTEFDSRYDALASGTANKLREVAKMIYGIEQGELTAPAAGEPDIRPRHFWVDKEGYDTHADQGGATGRHFDLHAEVAAAVKVFYDDVADMGAADKLCILMWSEFSRRLQQNQNGTDHGSQGPVFVIGGTVNGGLYGNHPNIDPAAVDDRPNTIYRQGADPFRSTDFRDVYGTILKHWMNVPHGVIVPNVLPLDTGPGLDPDLYWTVENFDLAHPLNGSPLFLP